MFKFLSLFLCPALIFGATTLKEKFQNGEKGDYIVSYQGGIFTLLAIHDKKGEFLTLDEASIPECNAPTEGYKAWAQAAFPNATCRTRFTMNLNTGAIVASNRTLSKEAPFLATLLTLSFETVSEKDRRRVGGGPVRLADRRPLWNPPLYFEGKKIEGVKFSALRTLWPRDSSELSGLPIVIYLPEESDKWPAYFPYWVEVGGVLGKAKIRIVDSGKHLITGKE